jgi:hypothetical protein
VKTFQQILRSIPLLIGILSWNEKVQAGTDQGNAVPKATPLVKGASGSRWYGWQTLLVDGVGLGVGLAFTQSNMVDTTTPRPSDGAVVGTSMYAMGSLGSPLIHFAHHNTPMAFGSLAIRLFVPPTFALFGTVGSCFATYDNGFSRCGKTGATTGFLVGTVVGAAVDSLFLAREPEKASDDDRQWYGWQTMVVDGVGLGLGVYGAFRTSDQPIDGKERTRLQKNPMLGLAVGWYLVNFFVPPIVHWGHGEIGKGFLDFGIRSMGTPLGAVVGMIGYCAATGAIKGCSDDGFAAGWVGSLAIAAMVDASLLAYKKPAVPDKAESKSSAKSKTLIVPMLVPQRSGASMMLVGSF